MYFLVLILLDVLTTFDLLDPHFSLISFLYLAYSIPHSWFLSSSFFLTLLYWLLLFCLGSRCLWGPELSLLLPSVYTQLSSHHRILSSNNTIILMVPQLLFISRSLCLTLQLYVSLLNSTSPLGEVITFSIWDSGHSVLPLVNSKTLESTLSPVFLIFNIQSNGRTSSSAFNQWDFFLCFRLYPASGHFSPPPLLSLWPKSPSFLFGLVHNLVGDSLLSSLLRGKSQSSSQSDEFTT